MKEVYSEYVKGYYLGVFGVSIDTYDQEHLKNTTAGVDSGMRLLLLGFQICKIILYLLTNCSPSLNLNR